MGVKMNKNEVNEMKLKIDEMDKKIEEIYLWYKNQEKQNQESDKLVIDDFEGDVISRSFKIYEPIQKEFVEFCKANNKYKIQDIISQFIKEGLEKYK